MNKEDNLKMIEKVGDVLQLKYGNDFGYYSVLINKKQLNRFCSAINSNTWFKNIGFFLDTKLSENNSRVMLYKNDGSLCVPVKLLDHTVYIDASERDWSKISEKLFLRIHDLWRKYLAMEVEEYNQHMKKRSLLISPSKVSEQSIF